MAQCSGKCTKQVFESKNLVIDRNYTKVPADCEDAKVADVRRALESAIALATQDVISGCAEDCRCELLKNQDPEWTEWVKTPVETSYTREKCTYHVKGEVEIRSRIFDGLCLPERIKPISMGIIPDFDLVLTFNRQINLSPDALFKIKEVIRTLG